MIREINEHDLQGLLELYMQLHDNPIPEFTQELMDLWQGILKDYNHHIIVLRKMER